MMKSFRTVVLNVSGTAAHQRLMPIFLQPTIDHLNYLGSLYKAFN